MKTILKRFRNKEITADQALRLVGELIAKTGQDISVYESFINEIIGLPEEPAEEGNELEKQAWERYHRGE
jgi:hypothetical protein